MRIDKLLSELGLCTRREAAKIAKSGGISVDGAVVKDVSKHVDPETSRIILLGREVVYKDQYGNLVHGIMASITTTRNRFYDVVSAQLQEIEGVL